MKDALAIHRALLEREIAHEIVRLPVAIARADELPGALGLPADRCLATRVYACVHSSDGAFRGRRFLTGVIVAAGRRPAAEAVRVAAGARLIRPARADLINSVTEYAAGLVCPLLLPGSMPLLIDRRLVDDLPGDEVVYTATGEPSTALGIRGRSLYRLCQAKPVDLFPSARDGSEPGSATSDAPEASPRDGPGFSTRDERGFSTSKDGAEPGWARAVRSAVLWGRGGVRVDCPKHPLAGRPPSRRTRSATGIARFPSSREPLLEIWRGGLASGRPESLPQVGGKV
ncbi:aminoacyl-tRNA deacylase [Actinomadura terrae]|uniref:aminoacyl-tRNA deacylase n=1 Tax=Actinomadura terrae TaxID=604353 RepID=UPI001FA764F9|nr:YbaK/EbsC family protein [Actinomadura terrae]